MKIFVALATAALIAVPGIALAKKKNPRPPQAQVLTTADCRSLGGDVVTGAVACNGGYACRYLKAGSLVCVKPGPATPGVAEY
jgi:hypothetical protein